LSDNSLIPTISSGSDLIISNFFAHFNSKFFEIL
jgi:hypothetical protein